ncbi:MAG: VacB/RNase II family 3'-5' exoribonuclease [Leptospirales bacterium]|nr:VacB/RNase II family 3'-5' exoribonuclease [Leptospirales bacterium]
MSIIARLLRFLERRAGETIKLADLFKHLQGDDARPRSHKSGGKGKLQRKDRDADSRRWQRADLEAALAALVELGVVHLSGSGVVARKPFLFRGKISLSPRGMAFVALRGASPTAREVFVAPQDQRGALPGDDVLLRLTDRSRDRFEGVVSEVLQRARQLYRLRLEGPPRNGLAPGVVLDAPGKIAACADVRRLPADTLARLKTDQVVIVKLSGRQVRYQGAHFQEAIFQRFENANDMDADYARILMKYDIDPVYPDEIELPGELDQPTPDRVHDWKKRADLRQLYTITIDGADSKDFDDALSLQRNRSGLWKLFVHIADVSHYVKKGGALDREAARRATSCYLANRVAPMLPPVLSENLCSLVAGKDRLAFTAEMHIDPGTGAIRKAEFYKSVIHVNRRLTYDIAETEIDQEARGEMPRGKRGDSDLASDGSAPGEPSTLTQLWNLALLQRRQRMAAGRIDLDVPESKVRIGADDRIEAIDQRARLKSSMLIEECMLSANIAVAEALRRKKSPTLFRVHEPMDEAKVLNLNAFFESYNVPFTIKDSSSKRIQKAIEAVRKHLGGEKLERVFHMTLLRSFMQASYRPQALGHWGLGFRDYCHFTSPIRRYPDLVVHRSLEALLARKKPAYLPEEVEELGYHCSEQERNAMDAERDLFKLKVMRYLEQRDLRSFRGVITGFKPDRVFLEISDAPAEAVVEAQHLTNERELPLPDRFSVYVKRLGRPALLGEEWDLALERLDFEEMRIYCRPLLASAKGK